MKKSDIINKLLENCRDRSEMEKPKYHKVNNENWTIVDLFIRQYLNNGCDGFGLENVGEMYLYLKGIKKELIDFNLISIVGTNNSNYPLWNDYNF